MTPTMQAAAPTKKNHATTHCTGCGVAFASRNAMFRHLKETAGACLTGADHANFVRYVATANRDKVLVLYGYTLMAAPRSEPTRDVMTKGEQQGDEVAQQQQQQEDQEVICNGSQVAAILQQVLEQVQRQIYKTGDDDDGDEQQAEPNDQRTGEDASTTAHKWMRSYGTSCRAAILAQDDGMSAVSEVLSTRLYPLTTTVDVWMDTVNQALQLRLLGSGTVIRVLGRQTLQNARFSAEMDVTHRRVEYLLPLDLLYPIPPTMTLSKSPDEPDLSTMATRFDVFASFCSFASDIKKQHASDLEHAEDDDEDDKIDKKYKNRTHSESTLDANKHSLEYLFTLKSKMKLLATQIVKLDMNDKAAVFEKEQNIKKRERARRGIVPDKEEEDGDKGDDKANVAANETHCKKRERVRRGPVANKDNDAPEHNHESKNDDSNDNKIAVVGKEDASTSASPNKRRSKKPKKEAKKSNKGTNVLKRKRYHNFTPTVMAHEYLASRRLDRIFHRGTIRFVQEAPTKQEGAPTLVVTDKDDPTLRPFFAISLTGDMFLTGQACRVIGMLVALARGMIEEDIVDALFDEDYAHLIPTPPVPVLGLYAGEAFYTTWEGKAKAILTPRKCNRYPNGWGDASTLERVAEWEDSVRVHAAQAWLAQGVDETDGRLLAEKQWTEAVLEPWAEQARQELKAYRAWKAEQVQGAISPTTDEPVATISANLPPLETIDATVPALYEKVLHYLREADSGGNWPTTTPKRKLVMVSTLETTDEGHNPTKESHASSLNITILKAKANKTDGTSPYSFSEGQGGASGSFSVGAMPGSRTQPKANEVFPELMKAAFELEIALCPGREPSSTIAINRNAQFRPHVDSGAGAGQSTSLIVGLGGYVGGDLVVEGEKKDIRYKPIEFNGWKQRHWTMPFRGERFSLVWFTPKGCEGVRGIDLCVNKT